MRRGPLVLLPLALLSTSAQPGYAADGTVTIVSRIGTVAIGTGHFVNMQCAAVARHVDETDTPHLPISTTVTCAINDIVRSSTSTGAVAVTEVHTIAPSGYVVCRSASAVFLDLDGLRQYTVSTEECFNS